MKKISLIAGLAMLVTVGGVFAAWEFGSVTVDPHEQTISISVDTDITDKESDLSFSFTSEAFTVKVTQDTEKTGYLFSADTPSEGYISYTYENDGDTAIGVKIKAEIITTGEISTYMDTTKNAVVAEADLSCVTAGGTVEDYVTLDHVVTALNNMDKNAIDSKTDAETFTALMGTANLLKVKVTITAA